MADDLQRVNPGDPITKMFRSSTWNRVMEAVRFVEGLRGSSGALPGGFQTGQTIRYIRNDTGADVARGNVLGVSDFLYAPEDNLPQFFREPSYIGVVPAASHHGKFCVTIEPIAPGKMGRAVFAGLAQVMVDTDAEYAEVSDGDVTQLAGVASGSAKVVARNATNGWATVRLGGGASSGSSLRWGLITTDLNQGGTCTIQEYSYDCSGYCGTGETFTGARDPLGELVATGGLAGAIFWVDSCGSANIIRVTCPDFEFAPCTEAT